MPSDRCFAHAYGYDYIRIFTDDQPKLEAAMYLLMLTLGIFIGMILWSFGLPIAVRLGLLGMITSGAVLIHFNEERCSDDLFVAPAYFFARRYSYSIGGF